MKKIIFSIGLICGSIVALAQAPANYYSNATGQGYTLKTQLYNIIKNHTTKSYASLWGLYTGYPQAFNDNWYDSSDTNKIMDIYSENPTGPDPYTYTPGTKQCGNYSGEGSCYNREHLIPQSVFNEASPMVSDPFHIWPTDGYVNGKRSNYAFGVVGTAEWTSRNGSKLGNNNNSGYSAGYSGKVFEPIDEFKGDIARAYFYFATRYQENNIQNWNYAMFNNTKDKVFTDTFLRILMTWHVNDPVSPREIALNNAIYSYQNNRNPFIDNPEYAQRIWGNNLAAKDIELNSNKEIAVYKIKENAYKISTSNQNEIIKEVQIFNFNGQKINSVINDRKSNTIKVEINTKGIFILKVIGNTFEVNKKVVN